MRCAISAAAACGWWWPPIRSIRRSITSPRRRARCISIRMGLVYVAGCSLSALPDVPEKRRIDKLGVDVNVFRAGTFKSFN